MRIFKKTVMAIIATLLVVAAAAFAADDLSGRIMQEMICEGLQHVDKNTVDNTVFPYKGKQYSDDLFLELVGKLYDIEGVSYIDIDASIIPESGNISVTFHFHEIPVVSSISVSGNSRLKTAAIKEAVTSISEGDFLDPEMGSRLQLPAADITAFYHSKGFGDVSVSSSWTLDETANEVALSYEITEGVQKRIVAVAFEGNENASYSTLKGLMKLKVKSLFNNGYLDESIVETDRNAIVAHYQQQGFVDAQVSEVRYDVREPKEGEKAKDYTEIIATFVINEGKQWKFGGLSVSGNTVFSDERIRELVTMEEGETDNLEKLSGIISSITDLYYNDGYIFMSPSVSEFRDEEALSIAYGLTIVENERSTVSKIVLNGLSKTKEYVLRRELALTEGKIFSKADLVTSYKNLYNTGLLTNLSYKILPSGEGNDVVVQFDLEEGKQMDIQFGATFGGNVSGFPISGFLQWNDKNLFGEGKDFSIGTTLSPDTQSVEVSLGDDWFGNKRWANKIAFSFSRTLMENVLQQGIGSERDDGKTDTYAYPLGYASYAAYEDAGYAVPDSNYLMSYKLMKFNLAYTTGYTFIFEPGRLSLSTGLSVGLNRAYYDHSQYNPYEELIYKYGEAWQFSNRLNLSVQWDGRDLIYYTSKGYVLSQSFTYAGGVLFGLSNYIKSVTQAAGYFSLFSVKNDEGIVNNCVFCATTTLNLMLPQYYKADGDSSWAWHDAGEGATKYEMLYIDGMTVGRGFDVVYGLSFLWDNTLEISYPLVRDVLNFEAFTSATAGHKTLAGTSFDTMKWWFAGGAGIKLKIPGFPIGLYVVKNATFNVDEASGFAWDDGSLFWGTKLVLAISTSLI